MPVKRTIFVVDVDEDLNQVVVEALAESDYSSRGFYDAHAAINAILAGDRPDLLLLDWRLPGTTAEDFLTHLDDRGVRLCTLLYSAFARQIPEATRRRVGGVLAKPCTLTELHAAIERALSASVIRPPRYTRGVRGGGARSEPGALVRRRVRSRRIGCGRLQTSTSSACACAEHKSSFGMPVAHVEEAPDARTASDGAIGGS